VSADFIIRSRRVVLPSGMVAASVHVRDGRIAQIAAPETVGQGFSPGIDIIDAGNDVLIPGLVDSHVHLNEPGRAEWEGFASGTRAAAAGGVTTVVDMPLNSVPATTSVAGFEQKLHAAADKCTVDVGFWGGVVPDNAADLEPLWNAGVLGFKAFLVPSGVPEFLHVDESDLGRALPVLARCGAPLLVHAELPEALNRAPAPAHARNYGSYLATRPEEAEELAVALLVRLARDTGARIHVVHLSSHGSIPILCAARRDGLEVTAETCPHYLMFDADTIARCADRPVTLFKCAPPIRHRAHADRLWGALTSGEIDMIASDHSPCAPDMKAIASGDLMAAWGGIASLQLGLSIVWTLARARGVPIERVVRWMSGAPAKLAGIHDRKGAIAPGLDADLVVFDPDASFQVDGSRLHHRHALTPYEGQALQGVVRMTFVRGQLVYDRGEFPGPRVGRVLLRTPPGRVRLQPDRD
jgi:allantoinase